MCRELRIKILLLLFPLLGTFSVAGQRDSLPYSLYSKKLVFYTDLGFNTAPVRLKYPYTDDINKLKLRNNSSVVLGLGFSYKWFTLRLGLTLPGTLRPVHKYGKTNYFDLGFDFTLKRVFFDVDFHLYEGYAIKKAYRWNDTLSGPNEIRSDINTASLSLNAWVFRSKDFKMQAMRGKTGSYVKDIQTWYFKYTVNLHGIGTSFENIAPIPLLDSSQSKTLSKSYIAFDFGLVPGYAYVKRWKNYQIGAMAGLGLVIQSKFYNFGSESRGFLGLAPRFDVKFIAGYNQPRYFVMFVTDFDNKSIRFNDLRYRQTYYSLKVVGGIRLDKKERKKPTTD